MKQKLKNVILKMNKANKIIHLLILQIWAIHKISVMIKLIEIL